MKFIKKISSEKSKERKQTNDSAKEKTEDD